MFATNDRWIITFHMKKFFAKFFFKPSSSWLSIFSSTFWAEVRFVFRAAWKYYIYLQKKLHILEVKFANHPHAKFNI